jgi:hypothetical protein
LAGFGLSVAMPRGGAARDDLFVADAQRGRPLRVQVKTACDPYGRYQGKPFCSWPTNCSIINSHDESLWFAFVALRGWPKATDLPEVLFVRSDDVAERMKLEQGKSRTFYWIYEEEAEVYKGEKGISRLKAALDQPCHTTASTPTTPSADETD